jgi:hypothetical protein
MESMPMSEVGNCTKCKKTVKTDQTYLRTTEFHWDEKILQQVQDDRELLCKECYAEKLVEELNEIRATSIFPNYSPWQFQRMEWIRKKINQLGYELT